MDVPAEMTVKQKEIDRMRKQTISEVFGTHTEASTAGNRKKMGQL